jgi:hypothetical protein
MKIGIFNAVTGENIVREMTEEESAQWEIDKAQAVTKAEAKAAKTVKRQALLDKLGITEDEARLLLGGN